MAPSDRRESDLDAAVQPGRRPVHDRAQIRWRDREGLLARGAAPAARHAGLLSSQGGRRLTDPDDGPGARLPRNPGQRGGSRPGVIRCAIDGARAGGRWLCYLRGVESLLLFADSDETWPPIA